MKTLYLAVLIASAAMPAGAADKASFTGNWKVHNNIAGNESEMTCSFTQKEKVLTGECSSDQGSVNISGSVDDKKIIWTYKSEYNGGPITLTYTGNLDAADKMSGSVKVEEFGVEGEFTATSGK